MWPNIVFHYAFSFSSFIVFTAAGLAIRFAPGGSFFFDNCRLDFSLALDALASILNVGTLVTPCLAAWTLWIIFIMKISPRKDRPCRSCRICLCLGPQCLVILTLPLLANNDRALGMVVASVYVLNLFVIGTASVFTAWSRAQRRRDTGAIDHIASSVICAWASLGLLFVVFCAWFSLADT